MIFSRLILRRCDWSWSTTLSRFPLYHLLSRSFLWNYLIWYSLSYENDYDNHLSRNLCQHQLTPACHLKGHPNRSYDLLRSTQLGMSGCLDSSHSVRLDRICAFWVFPPFFIFQQCIGKEPSLRHSYLESIYRRWHLLTFLWKQPLTLKPISWRLSPSLAAWMDLVELLLNSLVCCSWLDDKLLVQHQGQKSFCSSWGHANGVFHDEALQIFD